ncbi:hypothetical protein ACFFR3_41605 [Nonomuraea salmonea]|uniref:Alcohol dehydrogenase-like C-terminal domain-containing protein n=1 Tax=Nonomuraea salmonea TaxID=46181 RepID=A0ABV5P0E2_9ACTN
MELAALGGAHVIASVGSPARAEGPAGLGADEVVVGLDGVDRPVDLILDTVGGPGSPPGSSWRPAGTSRTSAGHRTNPLFSSRTRSPTPPEPS